MLTSLSRYDAGERDDAEGDVGVLREVHRGQAGPQAELLGEGVH